MMIELAGLDGTEVYNVFTLCANKTKVCKQKIIYFILYRKRSESKNGLDDIICELVVFSDAFDLSKSLKAV